MRNYCVHELAPVCAAPPQAEKWGGGGGPRCRPLRRAFPGGRAGRAAVRPRRAREGKKSDASRRKMCLRGSTLSPCGTGARRKHAEDVPSRIDAVAGRYWRAPRLCGRTSHPAAKPGGLGATRGRREAQPAGHPQTSERHASYTVHRRSLVFQLEGCWKPFAFKDRLRGVNHAPNPRVLYVARRKRCGDQKCSII